MSDMKNMIVLRDLPSNLIEEAFVVLKENKKIHKYQTIDNAKKGQENTEIKNDKGYIIKEAEMLLKSYTEKLEKKPSNTKKLERRYKNSIKLNFFLFFTTILGITFSVI